uniref:RNase H family protein n=1 Tax=Solanum tuberosum TaxID=4113 RepID=M1E0C2_SOLTU
MPHTNITHLPSVGSDHCPLLMEMTVRPENHIKYFRFLNCWADQPAFAETVTNCWNRPIERHPMWIFHQKMKRLASTLSAWSKMQFGDIYAKVRDYEEKVRLAEEDLIHNNTEEQRTKLHGINAEYIKFMKLEDSILKQKTQLQWFKEGDGNSKYFHALIRGRRRRLFIHKILKDNDEWVQGDDHIAQAACEHFQNIFTGEEKLIDEIPMECIPRIIMQEQNDRMKELPTLDELKEVVQSLNPNSAAGPDGMNGPKIIYFSELISKVVNRVAGWQSKLLSFGGKVTLIKHVLQSLPIHILAATSTPSTVMKQIQGIMADFFWGWRHDKKKYHWSSWKNLSFPYDEGGIEVRLMNDMCQAFQFKQWWTFRSKHTLWGDFLKAKYCQRSHPISKKWDTGESQAWRLMMKNKHTVESNIQWKIRSGSCSFWWDNWLGVGPLAHYTTNSNRFNNDSVSEFIEEGHWNIPKVIREAPPSQVHHILSMQLQLQQGLPDQAVWKLNTSGLFSVSSAWNSIREKKEKTKINKYTWHPKIPFKCSFLLWRAIRGKLPTNEKLLSFGIEPSDCHCCHSPGIDTIEHTFNSGDFAKNVWRYFAISLGIRTDFLPLRNMIMRWWSAPHNNEAHKLILHSTPIFICWNLWKNRCAVKYGGKQSNIARVKHLVILDNFKLLHTVFPYISWPLRWNKLCNVIENCSQDTKVTAVQWTKPPYRWVKLNTDGSALSNPGSIGVGGVIRNHLGEIILAYSAPLGTGTNNQAEVEAAIFA